MDPSNNARAATGQTQAVFRRLDPLLERLLQFVTRYRDLVEGNIGVSDDEHLFQVVLSQVEVLDQIQEALEQFGPPFAPSLIVLADYVSLPLTAIFHIKTTRKSEGYTDDEETLRRWKIRQSYVRRLHLSAAKTTQAYVRACCDPSTDPENESLSISLSSKHSIKFLVALTNAIPLDLEEEVGFLLDAGSELWIALLSSLTTIIQVGVGDLSDALEGNLVARLVDCTTSLSAFPNQDVSLQALKSLQSILTAAPKPSLWQSIFPGVFAALYRRIVKTHRYTPSGLSTSIVCQCLSMLIELFRVTLAPLAGAGGHEVIAKSATAMLQQLQSIAKQSSRPDSENDGPPEQTPNFSSRVQKSVVAPLSILLRQEVISPVPKVRVHLACLCQVFLKETRDCWKETKVLELALETCLILETDSEESVASRAATIIREYQEQLGDSIADSSWMISRILALMEELPVLAQGSKSVEMRMHLQLLTGYLHTVVGSNGAAALSASPKLRRSLVQLTDVDFASASRQSATPVDSNQSSGLRLRRLNLESERLSREMLRALGKTLGFKKGAIVVDACISDIYEIMMEKQSLSYGDAYIELLHEWIGSLVVAKEILIGAFSATGEDAGPKQERRRRRVLQSLASSVLPLLVDFSLWTPSTRGQLRGSDQVYLSSTPLLEQGSACITVLLLEVVGAFSELLGEDVDTLLSSTLYPIVDKASHGNSAIVQQAALRAARSIARSRSVANLNEFLRRESHNLMASMLGRLRLPGGVQVPRDGDLEEILVISASLRWVLEEAVKANSETTWDSDSAAVSSLIDLMTLLTERLDHLLLRKRVPEDDIYDLPHLHKACFDYLFAVFGGNEKARYCHRSKGTTTGSSQPWLDLLSPFRKASLDDFQAPSGEEEGPSYDLNDTEETSVERLSVGMTEVNFVSKIIFRGCYFLSSESLRVQIATCDSLSSGFKFLAFVACVHEDSTDEESTIRNSILRQVHSSWPSIKARLLSLSDKIVGPKIVHSLLVVRPADKKPSQIQDVATQRICLATIFTLVAEMCECSGDFMADRFKNNVWSSVALHLGRMIEKRKKEQQSLENRLENKMRIQLLDTPENSYSISLRPSSLRDSERLLLLSILKCLSRVFRADCGIALSSIMGGAGSMVLPFLDDGDKEIVSGAMETLKCIAAVDSDVLLRPLLQLSGRGIPRCPLKKLHGNNVEILQLHGAYTAESPLRSRCQELLIYIESLPEQLL